MAIHDGADGPAPRSLYAVGGRPGPGLVSCGPGYPPDANASRLAVRQRKNAARGSAQIPDFHIIRTPKWVIRRRRAYRPL
jgi:hypothetical protein